MYFKLINCMIKNNNLTQAKKAKNDEFYTLIEDVEKEVSQYKDQFKDKVIYCNCDDYKCSNFYKYFKDHFKEYKLKRLIASCLTGEYASYDGNVETTGKLQNVDFRKEESVELLKQSDIICTNPPFSLFEEYIKQLLSSGKKFLILGNNNACPQLIQYFKNKKLRLGYSVNKTMEFEMPDNYKSNIKNSNGKKVGKVPAISWFTNFEITPNEKLALIKKYNSTDFPTCDNYNAIYVDKVANIPKDYNGAMAVPITILKYMNKNNIITCEADGKTKFYKILGATYSSDKSNETQSIRTDPKKRHNPFVNGKEKYTKILIQRIS